MSTKTLLTLADFEKLQPPDGLRYELDEGELVTMTFPRPEHNRVVKQVFLLLHDFLEAHPLGELFFPDTGFVLSREPVTLRGPDLSFLRADRARRVDPKPDIDGAPDLVIEVVSPTDSAQDLNRKVHQYLHSGAQEVWVAHPDTREIYVHDASGVRRLGAHQVLESQALLPGFSIPVETLFPN